MPVADRQRNIVDRALKLDQLIDGAEELLTKLADAHDPHVQRLRDRVDDAVRDAHRAIGQGNDVRVRLRDIAHTVDDYVRDHPWLAMGTGIVAASMVAFLAGVTIGAKRGQVR